MSLIFSRKKSRLRCEASCAGFIAWIIARTDWEKTQHNNTFERKKSSTKGGKLSFFLGLNRTHSSRNYLHFATFANLKCFAQLSSESFINFISQG